MENDNVDNNSTFPDSERVSRWYVCLLTFEGQGDDPVILSWLHRCIVNMQC